MASTAWLTLDVPFADKDRVKALGARWDHRSRRWYVPAGADTALFAPWLPTASPALPSGPTIPAGVLFFPQHCYRCGAPTTCVAGLLVDADFGGDADGYIPFGEIAGYVIQLLSRKVLDSFGVGRIGFRRSSVRPEGYIANGCRNCDTIMGEFYLEEGLTEYLAEGGDYPTLAWTTIELPIACMPVEEWQDEDDDSDYQLVDAEVVR